MKDHEKRELINKLRDVAIKYHACASLRERIAKLVMSPVFESAESIERETTNTSSKQHRSEA